MATAFVRDVKSNAFLTSRRTKFAIFLLRKDHQTSVQRMIRGPRNHMDLQLIEEGSVAPSVGWMASMAPCLLDEEGKKSDCWIDDEWIGGLVTAAAVAFVIVMKVD